jgi:hypothetical protein
MKNACKTPERHPRNPTVPQNAAWIAQVSTEWPPKFDTPLQRFVQQVLPYFCSIPWPQAGIVKALKNETLVILACAAGSRCLSHYQTTGHILKYLSEIATLKVKFHQ